MAYPVVGTLLGIALLLFLILRFKIPAFIALLLAKIGRASCRERVYTKV